MIETEGVERIEWHVQFSKNVSIAAGLRQQRQLKSMGQGPRQAAGMQGLVRDGDPITVIG
jgi:hypothetical protein